MNGTKMILLIGRSGKGKSTLANVVSGTSEFKESSGSASETKKIKFEKFKENNVNYLIIDTPGIGDTKISNNEVLDIIAEAVYLVRDGVSQIFFVVDGRFDQYEMATYDLLRTILFDENITKHTTIVRTNFKNFEKLDDCRIDIDRMVKEANQKEIELKNKINEKEKEKPKWMILKNNHSKKILNKEIKQLKKELANTNLAKIIKSCQEKIVYVNNPYLKLEAPDSESEEDRKQREEQIEKRKEIREKSRKILLKHLSENCQKESYKPKKLTQLSNEIKGIYSDYLTKKKELEEEMEELRSKENRTDVNHQTFLTQNNGSSIVAKENNQIKTIVIEKKSQLHQVKEKNNSEGNIGIIDSKEQIAQLQDKKEKLKKEIAEKEKIIRQKVLKHIFNNYDRISKELGGDIFLNSVTGDRNWQEIHSEFADQKKILKWLEKGFAYEQTKDWATALNDFNPKIDADFCAWLRDIKKLTVEKMKRSSFPYSVEQLRGEYTRYLKGEINVLDKHNQQLKKKKKSDWKDINSEFTSDIKKAWKDKKFNYKQCRKWEKALGADFSPSDYDFYSWVRDNKKINPKKIDDIEKLKKEYENSEEINWKNIHEDFSNNRKKQWKEKKITYQEAKKWVEIGFTPDDLSEIMGWKEQKLDYKEVKEWKDAGFSSSDSQNVDLWKKNDLTCQDAQEWIMIGFKPSNYKEVKEWKNKDFDPSVVKEWISAGFELSEAKEAQEWKNQGLDPSTSKLWMKVGFLSSEHSWVKEWKKIFTVQEVRQWIKNGFNKNNFNEVKEWENHKFTPQEAGSWIGKGLKIDDYEFAHYLKKDDYQPSNLNKDNLEELRKKVSWQDVYKDFTGDINSWERKKWEEKKFDHDETKSWIKLGFTIKDLDQVLAWKSQGFDHDETKSWIKLGFTPSDLGKVLEWKEEFTYEQVKELIEMNFSLKYAKQWKDLGFSFEEIKEWIKTGLNLQEEKFANHLRQSNIQSPQLNAENLFQLRKEYYPDFLNAKNYLDIIIYPQERRKNLTELNLRNLNLEGDLDLGEFSDDLKKIYLTGNPQLGEIKNKPNQTTLIYQNPREWLNHEYPNKKKIEKIDLDDLRKIEFEQSSELIINNLPNLKEIKGRSCILNLTKLTITNCPRLEIMNINSYKNFQQLSLNNLPNLKEFDCVSNNLINLDLTDCINLQSINCSNNQLNEIKFTSSGEKLKRLNLENNNFDQDLSFLKNLVNLEHLYLRNNKFFGSLEHLKNINKLERLDISNTDIDSGLEYLPDNIEDFFCQTKENKSAECQKILNLLAEAIGNKKKNLGTDANGKIMNFHQILKRYKEKIEISNLLDQAKEDSSPEQTEINFLEKQVQELLDQIKKQRGKIADAYLHFCEEEKLLNSKELLRELIVIHLEIVKNRKQNVSVSEYEEELKQYNDIRAKIFFEKLKNDWKLIEEVEKILKGCESLVELEAELKTKLESKQLLIEEKKQNLQITDGKEKKELTLYKKSKISELEKKHQKQIKQYQGLSNRLLEDAVSVNNQTQNWQNIHPSFTSELQKEWENKGLAYPQVQEWANSLGNNFNPQEYEFIDWLAHAKNYSAEQVLNNDNYNLESLKSEFHQSQLQTQILQQNPPKNS